MNEATEMSLESPSPIEVPAAVWELTREELVFPIVINENKPPIYVHMRPYRAFDLKQLLANFQYRMSTKAGQNQIDLIEPPAKIVGPFFWKHFLKIANLGRAGEVLPLEEQKRWVESNPQLKIEWAVITQGYRGLSIVDDEIVTASPQDDGLFVIDDEVDHSVTVEQKLWQPALRLSQGILMTHRFRNCMHSDMERYKDATRSRINTKKQEWSNTISYDVIEQIYGSMIVSIAGMELAGKPCQEDNKKDWLEHVPFWHKDIVLANYFRGVQIKNA